MGNTLLGVDIGTTNISAVVIDCEKEQMIDSYMVSNLSKNDSEKDFSEFDAEWIVENTVKIVDHLLDTYPAVKAIGVTGQMHGFVYVSKDGKAVSPLYNWQDGRGNRQFSEEKTYCQEIEKRTGYACNSGYAFATMFYNRVNHLEPKEAYSFCSIMDYLVMVLTERKTPFIHRSNGAAFGLYNLKNNQFDQKGIEQLGLTHLFLPEIATTSDIAGYYRNVPVSVAIGDNQASFFGSVKEEEKSLLVNIGTGSQVSAVLDEYRDAAANLEIRPYVFGKYLISGSALCGGKSYAILEKFFSDYAFELSGKKESQYEIMNKMVESMDLNESPLNVSTLFCGTRRSPKERGSIWGIDDVNFTPANLILGVLYGMAHELKIYFDSMDRKDISHLVAAGNAVKRNLVLQKVLAKTFHSSIGLTANDEEAAFGSALFAGVCCKVIGLSCAKKLIKEKK